MSNSTLCRKAAFTLAEVLVTLTILGIVAAISVPSLVKFNTKRADKVKIIKAMATFEQFVPKYLYENGVANEYDATSVYNCNDIMII